MSALRPLEFLRVAPASAVASVQVSVAPTTGSANVRIPIPLTAGRDGFGPSLALAFGGYDPLSPFAHGWSLAGLPSVDVDVRDGLPSYDGQERFRYAGQELVPLELASTQREWERGDFTVRAFRTRVESVPIRAEQWSDSSGRIHWRVRTGDGSVQVFGLRTNGESRIADPASGERTFRWLLESVFDRLGNAMEVRYAAEDAVGVDALGLDGGRFEDATANRYPKRILYGNAAPYAEDDDTSAAIWYFEAVFDYGDHDETEPVPAPSGAWAVREDASFTGRLGFEIRTRRLCRRVLMFHHFEAEIGEASTLVGSFELDHEESPDASMLSRVRYVGWRTQNEERVSQATPWAEIAYTEAGTGDSFEVRHVPLLGEGTQLLDLLGEGLPGLFTATPGASYFARNLGDGVFGAHELVPEWPTGLERATLADFDRDGNLELVELSGPRAGYYRLDRRTRRWESLQMFGSGLATRMGEGPVFQADLSGDGRPDVVVLHESGMTWLPNLGPRGFGEPVEVRLPAERLPLPVPALDRFLADMTGDGLPDIVEALNGSVRYWPNLGRGRFGEPVVMDGAPRLDAEGAYDAARVLLVDLDQTGASDLVYLRGDGAVLRAANRRGASFGPLEEIASGAAIPNGARTAITDFYGDGSSCLLVFAPSGSGTAAVHALRLASSPGARQVASVTHPLGAVSELEWGHSVRHYLRDVESGRGWDSPLPSPRAVVDALQRTEPVDDVGQSERFAYHDGHYDPRERGFGVFAIADHFDADVSEAPSDVVPLLTRRFSHTGEDDYAARFTSRFYAGDPANEPPESFLEDPPPLDRDLVEAHGALLGSQVREELFSSTANGTPAAHPIRVSDSSSSVRLIRAADDRYRTAVQVVGRETRTSEYEESPDDPRIAVQRILEVDARLTPLLSIQAGLPRRAGDPPRFDAQERLLASAASAAVEHLDTDARFELAIPIEARSLELHVPATDSVFAADLAGRLATALSTAVPYDEPLDPESETLDARAITHTRIYYWNDERDDALPLGDVGAVTLPHHSEEAAYDRGQLDAILDDRIDPDVDLPLLGYVEDDDVFYRVGPTTRFGNASTFFRLEESEAYDGGVTQIGADPHHLVTASMTDPVENEVTAEIDYHVLAPFRLTDANVTVQEIDYDPLGVARRTSRYGHAMNAAETATVDHGFGALTPGEGLPSFEDALADPEGELGEAESLFLYEFASGGAPMRTLSLTAEELVDRGPDASSVDARARVSLTYFDGFGRDLQSRVLIEPGIAWTVDGGILVEDEVATRWRVSGYVAFDSKGRPTQQYEPFFRDEHAFEAALDRRRFGIASTVTYDAVGRQVREDLPNDTFTETVFAAWSRTSLDPNDTADRATDYIDARDELDPDEPEAIALAQALANADTPVSVHLDPLGREIATRERIEDDGPTEVHLVERSELDIRALSEETIDRRELTASTRSFDRLGRLLLETSMDAGEHRGLFDAEGREVKHWHEDTEERRVFDVAGRLTEKHVTHDSTTWLAERITYGEGATGAADRNQLGRVILVEDAAGTLATPRYGAFGEPLATVRTLTSTPGADPDWSVSVSLEASGYETRTAFDAMGRRIRAFLPDGTERRHEYLRSGPTSKLEVVTPDTTVHTILASAEYNARGQQVALELGNGVEVSSSYDAQTFRLYRRLAVLGTDTFQDLRHHYDPVGNVVYIDDRAQRASATHVINGLTITAERTFTYDARYQLIGATGRVHNALTRPDFRGDAPTSGSFRGTRRVGLNDGGAVSRYTRSYTYDAAGNLEGWSHAGSGGGNSWNNEKWVSSISNRSYLAYDLDNDPISNPESNFDARGQITSLPNVRSMEWSPRGQLRRVVLIERTSDPDDDEIYDYGADSKRLRKTTRRLVSGNVETIETIYLDDCELRRIQVSSTTVLERWSSHAADSETRYATLYRWSADSQERETDDTSVVRTHYHLGSSLGSVVLELGVSGEVLAYEEYFPYGGTAFLAGDSVIDIAFRTLRYAGKDQDDATGLYVFRFRYYAPFMGTWVSPDPAAEVDGPNRYWYARNNPVTNFDADGLQSSDEERDPPVASRATSDEGIRREGGRLLDLQITERDGVPVWTFTEIIDLPWLSDYVSGALGGEEVGRPQAASQLPASGTAQARATETSEQSGPVPEAGTRDSTRPPQEGETGPLATRLSETEREVERVRGALSQLQNALRYEEGAHMADEMERLRGIADLNGGDVVLFHGQDIDSGALERIPSLPMAEGRYRIGREFLERHRDRMESDPAYAEGYRDRHVEIVYDWVDEHRNDPVAEAALALSMWVPGISEWGVVGAPSASAGFHSILRSQGGSVLRSGVEVGALRASPFSEAPIAPAETVVAETTATEAVVADSTEALAQEAVAAESTAAETPIVEGQATGEPAGGGSRRPRPTRAEGGTLSRGRMRAAARRRTRSAARRPRGGGGGDGRGSRRHTIRSRLRDARLPGGHQREGPIRYLPPEGYNPASPLPRSGRGYVDRFGNVWQEGPYHGAPGTGFTHEWDVQLSPQGITRYGHLSHEGVGGTRYLNIRPDGRVSH